MPDDRAPEAAAAIAAGVERWRSRGDEPPRLRLAGAGRFGRGRFTVLWAGLAGDRPPLRQLAADVGQQLRQARLPFDDRRPFRPHLTFARPGGRLPEPQVAADLAALAEFQGQLWQVEEVRLMRSRLRPHPPTPGWRSRRCGRVSRSPCPGLGAGTALADREQFIQARQHLRRQVTSSERRAASVVRWSEDR